VRTQEIDPAETPTLDFRLGWGYNLKRLRGGVMFTAKVKVDGRFFIGAIEVAAHRDAYALESGKRYQGHVLDSVPTHTHYVELNNATWEEFNSEELEDLPGDFRLSHC
jgi:hypothetical protein